MGNIYKRGDNWYVDLRVNGRRIRKKAGKSKHLADLLLKDLEIKAERNQLGFLERKEIPLEEFIKEFLSYSQAQNRPSTTQRYQSSLNNFLKFIKTETTVKRLSDLTTNTIEKYKIWRKNIPVARNGCDPAKSKSKSVGIGAKSYTINFEIMTLKTMLKFAVKWKYLEASPTTGVKPLKTDDVKPRRFLTESECLKILRHAGEDLYPIFFTFLNTGMRKAELINLEWSDVDFKQGIIKIRRKTFWKPKTGEREIPINSQLGEVLNSIPRRGNFVFTDKKSHQLNGDKLRDCLISVAKDAGLNDLTEIHAFRHTFASQLIAKGVDLPTVQKLMGHSSIETTMIYTHQTTDHLRDAVKKLEFGVHSEKAYIIRLN